MMGIVAQKKIDGCVVRIGFTALHTHGAGMGCQVTTYSNIGPFYLGGVLVNAENWAKAKVFGSEPKAPVGLGMAPHVYAHSVNSNDLPAPLTPRAIVDMVFECLVERVITTNMAVFSDRVNRGSKMSPTTTGYKWGGINLSTAYFAKWLSERPDLGTLFSGPVFHNPNHSGKTDYSLCQVWQFLKKGRQMFVDETLTAGIGPDVGNLPRESFLNAWGKLHNEARPEEWMRITYDQV